MAGKNPLVILAGLLLLLVALAFYQWTLMTENGRLKAESGKAWDMVSQLKKERSEAQNRLAEISMTLDDKKRYISDLDGRFLKANADLEVKVKALQQCGDEKKKVVDDAEKQKVEVKSKQDELKKMEEEKKKVETSLEEFKKLCEVADRTKELTKKLCPQEPVVQNQA
ncbi:cingulin [Stegostoma tigrinum]|uniref:cingulin n=1 Tax=Stegostoma tigrinum TaxID=3053191 RepID=UPI0028708723|nr:cingulin [Stegostoma tigrinum]